MKPGIKFRKHILLPLSVTLLILLSASIVNTYRLKRFDIFRDDKTHIHKMQQMTHAYWSESSQVLNEAIYRLNRNKNLQKAWIAKDKNGVIRHAESILKPFFLDKKITHFYFLSHEINAEVINTYLESRKTSPPCSYDLLSEREQQVFRLIVEGNSTKKIADILCVSPKTVEKHRSNLMKKLGVKDLVEMVKYAIKISIIDPECW
jgi:DNA-binding NarL/FixJ family response regulator